MREGMDGTKPRGTMTVDGLRVTRERARNFAESIDTIGHGDDCIDAKIVANAMHFAAASR